MSDDKFAAAHQITSADVLASAKSMAEMMNLKRQKDALFKPLAVQLAHTIGALQALQITLANMPALTAKLSRVTGEAWPVLRAADKILEAEGAMLRG